MVLPRAPAGGPQRPQSFKWSHRVTHHAIQRLMRCTGLCDKWRNADELYRALSSEECFMTFMESFGDQTSKPVGFVVLLHEWLPLL